MQLDLLTALRPHPAKAETSGLEHSSSLCVQVMDCRRILKWTYAYGYYSFENENNKARQDFFEYNQVRDQNLQHGCLPSCGRQSCLVDCHTRGLGCVRQLKGPVLLMSA